MLETTEELSPARTASQGAWVGDRAPPLSTCIEDALQPKLWYSGPCLLKESKRQAAPAKHPCHSWEMDSDLHLYEVWARLAGEGPPHAFPLWSLALPMEGKCLAWQDCGSKRGWVGSQRRPLCRCYSGSGPHSTVLTRTSDLCLCLVAGSCPTLCDPMDCSPPGSSVHGDSSGKNTRVGCHALLRGGGSSHPRDWTQVSRIAGGLFTVWTTREAWEQMEQMGRRKLTLAAAHLVDTRPSSCPRSSPLWPRSQNIREVGGLSPLNKSSWIYPGDVRILPYMQVNHGDTPY